jgi:hypothetical protein
MPPFCIRLPFLFADALRRQPRAMRAQPPRSMLWRCSAARHSDAAITKEAADAAAKAMR